MNRVEIVTPPDLASEQAALLASFKLYLNVPADQTEDDQIILGALYGAWTFLENATGRVMVSTGFLEYWDGWPKNAAGQFLRVIELCKAPVIEVLLVEYFASDGEWVELDNSLYRVDKISPLARIELRAGEIWPTLYDGMMSVRVEYRAGYPDIASQPGPLRGAAALLGGAFYRADRIEDSFELAKQYYQHYIIKR